MAGETKVTFTLYDDGRPPTALFHKDYEPTFSEVELDPDEEITLGSLLTGIALSRA